MEICAENSTFTTVNYIKKKCNFKNETLLTEIF